MGKNKKLSKYPTVSICTPTFNRRPFVPMMLKCFEHQTYPKNKIEWIIIDDGTDKIQELVTHIPQVRYFSYDEKMTLGKKRNLLNEKATGDIIIYMDDDDYYPPERISHAVETLSRNPEILCAGSSAMFIYFKHINKMIQFGPYAPNHATAATFAFRRELLKITKFNEEASLAEEKQFLKDYTIPFVQLDPKKSILVFSHIHNSFDKKELLNQGPNPNMREIDITPSDLVKEPELLKFFMTDIDSLLDSYHPGKPQNKPDVIKQLGEMKESRDKMIKEHVEKQNLINKINEQSNIIQKLNDKNNQLNDKVKYLEEKITQIITEKIQERKSQLP